jgi:hypothetical protein
LGKRRHRRGYLRSEHKPDQIPPPGCVAEPTCYLEDAKSGVTLKSYIRYAKLSRGSFGKDLVVRLEWTLSRKPALERYLGGNQIKHLLSADLNAFLKRNLRLERVDHAALGNLFRRIKITRRRIRTKPANGSRVRTIGELWTDPAYRAERAAFLILRALAHREHGKFASWEQALEVCQNSPAQIRGYFRELRDGKRRARRGRPKDTLRIQRRAITDYRINACFRTIQLQRVPPPGIIIATQLK